MNHTACSSNIVFKGVFFYDNRTLVRYNHERADRLILFNESRVIEGISGVSKRLEKVLPLVLTITYLEKELVVRLLKISVLDSRCCRIVVRKKVFLDYIVFDIRHVVTKVTTLDLNCSWEGISIYYEASIIVLFEYTIEKIFGAVTAGSLLAIKVGEHLQDLLICQILESTVFDSDERFIPAVRQVFCPIILESEREEIRLISVADAFWRPI